RQEAIVLDENPYLSGSHVIELLTVVAVRRGVVAALAGGNHEVSLGAVDDLRDDAAVLELFRGQHQGVWHIVDRNHEGGTALGHGPTPLIRRRGRRERYR